ncbi:sterol desaturase family protein [Trichothermofontia sp.]
MSPTQPDLSYEPLIRLGCFLGVLILMALWEVMAPCRPLLASKPQRWGSNLGLVVLNTALLRTLFPLSAVNLAAIAAARGWGILSWLMLPPWLAVILSVVLLDLIIYGQHVLFHFWPPLWRLHKVHHADCDFDVTTGLRFHPLEILLSMGIKLATIVVLGPPALAVIMSEILLNATAMFNHSNVSLPRQLDRVLRRVIVTPDMHRVHHSAIPQETNSNFGFNLPWWDYLFGTYRDRPVLGNQGMTIGLSDYQQDLRVIQLPWLLLLPFRRPSHSSEAPPLINNKNDGDRAPLPHDRGPRLPTP